ncbi:MAG: CopG family antitoxin [bacterium]
MSKQKLDEYKETDFDYELDDEEAALLHATDHKLFEQKDLLLKKRKEFKDSAQNFINTQRKSINIRIPEHNLSRLRFYANQQGMPYQTLINTVLQQYLDKQEQSTP